MRKFVLAAQRGAREQANKARTKWQTRDVKRYLKLLGRIHELLRPRTYLEIGVAEGRSLAKARPPTLALGIDPHLNVTVKIEVTATLFQLTSDEFFQQRDVRAEFKGLPIDLAFIDGLHLFEQALRDFLNVERSCAPESVVLLHDCLPGDRQSSEREPCSGAWTGDVWKIIPCLSRYRPDLVVCTLDVPPSGLTVVRNLDPSSSVLADNYEQLLREFIPLHYDDLVAAGKDATLHVAPHDWATVRRTLSGIDFARLSPSS